jgi:outer membrane protein assembly factor BamB
MRTSRFCAVVSTSLFACALQADDWPQWRGPQRNGISKEAGLKKQWPNEGPKLLWQRKDIGTGYSTPAVKGDHLYLLGNQGMDDESVHALSIKDGKEVWRMRIGKVGPNQGPQYPGARSTPTIDGESIYALGSDGDLACMDTASGKLRWQKNLRSEFGGKPGNWAYAESPLVDGDVVACTPGGSTATLVALNKNSGDVIWKATVPGGDEAAYASIVIGEAGGVKQYVQFLQKGVVGVEAKTGKFLWRYDKTAEGSPANIPTPVVDKDYVYTATGRSGGGLIKLKKNGDTFEAEQIYFTPKVPTAIGGAVKLGEHLYGTTSQGLLCADFLTGNVKWQERGVGAGSVFYADGNLYVHGENGEVALVEASPDSYREKGRFAPPEQPDRGRSKAWTYPVVANGRLYIRDWTSLWVYNVKGN